MKIKAAIIGTGIGLKHYEAIEKYKGSEVNEQGGGQEHVPGVPARPARNGTERLAARVRRGTIGRGVFHAHRCWLGSKRGRHNAAMGSKLG